MRSLALFLFLINLIFYSWQFKYLTWLPWQPEHSVKWSTPSYFNDTPINITINLSDKQLNCFQIGPYKDLNHSKQIKNWLNNQEIIFEELETKKLISTWIYLPPLKNRQAAIRAENKLKQNRIADFMIITTGKFKYGISLGVFSQTKYVNRRIKELKAKGFNNFKLEKRYQTNYWLSVKIPSESDHILKNLKANVPNIIKCL
jgi:hypothetical protein